MNNAGNAEENLIDRLRLSPLEYIENFLWVQPKMGPTHLLKLKPAQQQYLQIVNNLQKQNVPIRIIILKSRQIGISTATESLIFHNTSMFQNVKSMIIAQDKEVAEFIFRMSRLFYDRLPLWLKPMRRYNTKQNILFENPDEKTRKTNPGLGSAIYIGTAKTVTLGSGYTLNNLHISELAKWKKPEDILLSVFQAVPSMAGSFICIESTAHGRGGYFYDMWKASLSGETGFTPIFLSWLTDPDCDFPDIAESHKMEIMSSLDDEEKELVGKYHATATQLAWRRWAIPNNCQGNIEKFHQEYPVTESRAFISSGQSVFGRAAVKTYYDMTVSGDKGYLDHFNATTLRFMEDSTGKWEVWNKPKEGARYVVGVDPAQGTEDGDYSVIEVFDTRLEQCAEYRARLNPHLFKYEVIKAAKYYNNAMLNIELNGPGYGIIGWLRERYFNFWKREKFDHEHRKKTETIGFESTPQSMGVLRERLLSVVGYKTIKIYSRILVQEMETLEYKNTIDGAWEAKSGEHDDTIVACGLSLLCLDQMGLFSPGSGLLNKSHLPGAKELNEAVGLINNYQNNNYNQNQTQGFDSWYLG